jgi:hypothetical protein
MEYRELADEEEQVFPTTGCFVPGVSSPFINCLVGYGDGSIAHFWFKYNEKEKKMENYENKHYECCDILKHHPTMCELSKNEVVKEVKKSINSSKGFQVVKIAVKVGIPSYAIIGSANNLITIIDLNKKDIIAFNDFLCKFWKVTVITSINFISNFFFVVTTLSGRVYIGKIEEESDSKNNDDKIPLFSNLDEINYLLPPCPKADVNFDKDLYPKSNADFFKNPKNITQILLKKTGLRGKDELNFTQHSITCMQVERKFAVMGGIGGTMNLYFEK